MYFNLPEDLTEEKKSYIPRMIQPYSWSFFGIDERTTNLKSREREEKEEYEAEIDQETKEGQEKAERRNEEKKMARRVEEERKGRV